MPIKIIFTVIISLFFVSSGNSQTPVIIKENKGNVNSVNFTPDSGQLISADEKGNLLFFETSAFSKTYGINNGSNITSINFSPVNNNQAVYTTYEGGVYIIKADTKEIIKNFSKSGNVYYAVYSNNGDKLAVAYTREPTEKEQNKGIRLNFIVDIHETVKFEKTKTLRLSIPNDPDGELFGSNIFETYRFNSFNCAFSQDDNYLTAGSMGKNIAVYSFEHKKFAPVYKGHSGRVMFVVFSDDGNYMASTSKDETVKLWDIKGGNTIITLKGHSGNVNSASFSPESKYLASASNDETVKIWDVKTSALVHTLKGFDSEVISVKFSPDGKYLAAGCEDKVLVWKTEDILKID